MNEPVSPPLTGPSSTTPSRRGLPVSLLLPLYVLVALAPVGLAYLQGLPLRDWAQELSSGLAAVAFAMLLMEFVLSGRFRTVSDRIGIDASMRFHRQAAYAATVALVLHPWLYSLKAEPQTGWERAAASAADLPGLALASGWAAWLALILLVVWASFRTTFGYRYETWRLCHGLGALVIAGFGFHHVHEAGRYSDGGWLHWFWMVLVVIAVLTLVNAYLLTPLRDRGRPYRVVSVDQAGNKSWNLVIEPVKGDGIDFTAGQFAWLTINRSPFSIREHPFSISSCPGDRPRLEFTIKEAGDFTSTIGQVPVGAPVYVDGPHGALTVAGREAKGLVLIAGGLGIAPIMSILRQARVEGDPRPIKLIYGNRIAPQILFTEELKAMAGELDLEVTQVLGEPPPDWEGVTGQLDREVLGRCLPEADRTGFLYVVCGPPPMIDSVERSLSALGVPGRQVLSEKFSYD